MTPLPAHFGHAPAELALNRSGLTLFALANAVRIGSSSPVYVAGLLRREPRIGVWSIETTRPLRHRPVDQRTLARPCDSGDHAKHAERDVHADVAEVVPGRIADLQPAGRLAGVRLERGTVAEVAPGERVTGPQAVDGTLEAHGATLGAGA